MCREILLRRMLSVSDDGSVIFPVSVSFRTKKQDSDCMIQNWVYTFPKNRSIIIK